MTSAATSSNQPATAVGDAHRPLRDVVCNEIRGQIIVGRYAPGSRLIEDRLAKELGVSRNPVRESLRVLETEGFVEMIPRRGAVVASITPDEAADIFEVRRSLEALAARLAVRRGDDTDVAELRVVVHNAWSAVEASDLQQLTLLNTRFHELVHCMARNGYLRDAMSALRNRMQWIFTQGTTEDRAAESVREHEILLDAIANRDEEKAAALVEAHIDAAWCSFKARQPASQPQPTG